MESISCWDITLNSTSAQITPHFLNSLVDSLPMRIDTRIDARDHGNLNSHSGIEVPTQKHMALTKSLVKDVFKLRKTGTQGDL
jgi:hypothetical protein